MSASLGLCTPGGGGGGGGSGGVCTAPPGGSPTCGGSGAATQGGGSTPSSGAGNPINLLNGNKYQEESDLAPLPGVLGLELKRYYNSQSTHPGLLGANWRMSYETVLYDLGSEIQIVQADGRRLMFQRGIGQSATLCSSPQPQDGQVRIEPAKDGKGQPTYYWRWADGRTLMFSSGSGGGYPLQSITAATGERVTLNYSPTGEITSIRDPQGRQLVFIYASAAEKRSRALKAIDTPLGRLAYNQDALGRLVEVSQAKDARSAPFLSRLYHYEDRYNAGHPQALTGISVRGPDPQTHQSVEQRLSTYVYNTAGLAILSTKGRPREMKDGRQVADTGIEQVEVAYLDKPLPQDVKIDRKTGEATPTRLGKAVLTNSLGQTTQVTSALIAGHFRLMEMRGPGCSTCGPGNMRYAYDAQGLLIRSTKLDDNGAPVRSEVTELDKYGRTARIGVQDYAANKAQPTRWTQRFEYPDVRYADGSVAVAPQPSLIAQPSVITGKEHTTTMRYNAMGQLVTVLENGFSPQDGTARAAPDGAPISRATTRIYENISGHSVLQRIDGPLGQGDTTRFDWDATGNYIVSVTLPGNLVIREVHDPVTGRPTQRIDTAGVPVRFEYAPTAPDMPSLVERSGQRTTYRFDLLGRLVRIDQFASDVPAARDRDPDEHGSKSIQLQYDIGDHLVAVTDAQGYKAQATLDAEGQALVAGMYEPQQALPLRATYRWYDSQRRLSKQLRADGRIDTWTYDRAGMVVDHLDGDDVMHIRRTNGAGAEARIDLAPDGLMTALFPNRDKGDAGIDARSIGNPQAKRDDFGRAVIEWRPEQGLALRTYDAADNLLREDRLDRDARPAGHLEQTFDLAGRLILRLTFDAQGQPKQRMEQVYAGALLKEQRNDAQSTAYEHDASGRIIATRVTLRDEQGQPVFATTLRTRYDAGGEPESNTLADGQVMRIERQATGVASRIKLQSAFWSRAHDALGRWLPPGAAHTLQAWLPEAIVVQDIVFHPYNGIVGYTQGNGLITRKTFDPAGRLTMLRTGDSSSRIGYDVGPRIRQLEDQAASLPVMKAFYAYDGFGGLKPEAPTRYIKTAFSGGAQAVGSVRHDRRGRIVDDGTLTYTYTENGQVETVLRDGKSIATYRYNADGQRVSKAVPGSTSAVTYYLWSHDKLVAEIDGAGDHRGEIGSQYLYLSVEGNAAPVAKLESAWADGNDTDAARTLYVHADHRGAPSEMTDATQRVVWRGRPDAWGFVKLQDLQGQQAHMNIRLPGQYFDAETGLHDNWHRTYDARPDSANRGRYLTPDPAGYVDGPDAYAYVGGDPVNKVDPSGLYEVDVHYYMTYFLATVLGMKPADAAQMALATQFIDDNNYTTPIATPLITQADRLRAYHFVLWTASGGYSTSTNLLTSIDQSQQLRDLRSYSMPATAPGTCAVPNNRSMQFMGEFLHAFEDSFGHRDQNNVPIPVYGGLGHFFYGHNPDYTYNHTNVSYDSDGYPLYDVWNNNASRTLAMETSTYQQIQSYMNNQNFYLSGQADKSKVVSISALNDVLTKFNMQTENNGNTDDFKSSSKKLDLLNNFLKTNGFAQIPAYSVSQACNNRQKNLAGLNASDYPAAILKTGTGFMGGAFLGTSC